jgi:hypothetical protein
MCFTLSLKEMAPAFFLSPNREGDIQSQQGEKHSFSEAKRRNESSDNSRNILYDMTSRLPYDRKGDVAHCNGFAGTSSCS